jgi:hypothetical protein
LHHSPKEKPSQKINVLGVLGSLQHALEALNVPDDIISYIVNLQKGSPKCEQDDIEPRDPELWEEKYTEIERDKRYNLYKLQSKSPWRKNSEYGLTQGSPLSPILCILTLDY